ncbi:MAG: hypothetical protein C5B49_03765 [Bdellovibrio sp.]|nr:MAG: hypothetical protein C5B49_03765 [Bdellovibrio sp.]
MSKISLNLVFLLAGFIGSQAAAEVPSTPTWATQQQRPVPNLSMVGASNTKGVGASLPMEMRVRHHLQATVSPESLARLPRTLVAFDYFFPTNFPALDSNQDLTPLVHAALDQMVSHHDIVLVGLLPTRDQFSSRAVQWLAYQNDSSFSFIVDYLSSAPRGDRSREVNRILREYARTHKQVQIVKVTDMVENLAEEWKWRVSQFFFDRLHFSDQGQALFFNSVLKAPLQNLLGTKVSDMPVCDLGREESLAIRALFTDSVEKFMRREKGEYWVTFEDPSQFAKPAFNPAADSAATNLVESNRRLKNLAEIIQKNGLKIDGFPVSIFATGQGVSHVALDLTQALFYTQILLGLVSGHKDVFENWGYDHWLSYAIHTFTATIPGTNYRFIWTDDPSDRALAQLEWYIFTTVEGQPDERVRLPYLDEKIKSEITTNPGKYPYLKYTFKLRAVSPDKMDR